MFLNLRKTHSQNIEYLICTHKHGRLGTFDKKTLEENKLSSMQSSNVSVSISSKSTDETVEPITHRKTQTQNPRKKKQELHQSVSLTTALPTWIKSVNVFLQIGQPKQPSTAWTPT